MKTVKGPLNLEKFTGRATPASSSIPRISIQTRGNMALNHAAFEALGEPAFVALLFDKERRIVALQPAKEGEMGIYPVTKQKTSRSYFISAKAFCAHYNIDIRNTRAFEPGLREGMLLFALSDGIEVVGRRPRGKVK